MMVHVEQSVKPAGYLYMKIVAMCLLLSLLQTSPLRR